MLFVNKIANTPNMNWVDLLLAIVVVLALIAGWYRGFIRGVLDLFVWIGTLFTAYLFYPYTARLIEKAFSLGVWMLPVAFLLTALVARLALGLLERLVTRSIPQRVNDNAVNRFLGILPGAINGWIYAIILSALLLSLPLKDSITTESRNSRFAGPLAMQSEWANRKLAPVFDEAVKHTMNSLTVPQGSHEKVDLPFTYDRGKVRPDLEAQMLELVNRERVSRGLKPVEADPEMTEVARAHSRDMFVRGYFAHENPDGKDPFQRMRDANVKFLTAGENLALAQTLEMAHTNLMNSPGHKANILQPAFGRLGIGILDGGYYGLMISQEFRN
jgi:uncharacterized protein YkwD